ncbi:MAG: YkgJ family cysteine cluster protein [Deltaproteobacteria bacterium]|nr:YkgJ family cysteine cluster protein [Deltaproteobacteria bacterium]
MNSMQDQTVFKPLGDGPFQFACHRDIPCFTQCCARLRLVLTPYDIVRMKSRLRLSSEEFLEKYTETLIDPHHRFPLVKLKMNSRAEGSCPFVTESGCAIYEDRPEACRLYPVGRASATPDGATGSAHAYFLVVEPHCLGFQEDRTWTLEEWLRHEGIREYAAMNDPWRSIMTSSKSLGNPSHLSQKHQMFFMASYNLDKFRQFIFKSKFFDRFRVDSELKDILKIDDTRLMHFAFDWLKFSLFGEKTIPLSG